MELNRESLRKVFGPSAEECAGSFLLEVDGVKQEVATMNLHTGTYALSVAGAALVAEAGAPVVKTNTKAAGGKGTGGKGATPTPVVSEAPVGLEAGAPTELTGGVDIDAALAGLELDAETE